MSLLKANNLKATGNYEKIRKDFLEVVETIIDKPTRTDCVVLTILYSDYSVTYLADIAQTLKEPKAVNQTMKYMYSYIAECFTACELKLFHKLEGYTIVDKVIQEALDNEGRIIYDYVDKIIQEIQDSYIEEVIVESEDDSIN